jgi:hypothetical protein
MEVLILANAELIRPPFQLGLGLAAHDYRILRKRAAAADGGGFAFVSTGDNPALMKDTYVSLTMMALATQRCRVGTGVTNCIHRDLLVTAAAMSSIESISPAGGLDGSTETGHSRSDHCQVVGVAHAPPSLRSIATSSSASRTAGNPYPSATWWDA